MMMADFNGSVKERSVVKRPGSEEAWLGHYSGNVGRQDCVKS